MNNEFETSYIERHDNLFGPIGTMTAFGRTRPMYRVPLISTSEVRESGELRYLLCGPALYNQIVKVVVDHEQASAEMNHIGAEVVISKTGKGIHTKYDVRYIPKTLLQGWTWRGLLLAAAAGAVVAASILWSMS
jgi:hypothetical protein